MSKTITIPVSAGNRLKVTLNGKEYDLPTGVEISVPDEVAALFDNNAANAPKTGREPAAWNDGAGGGGGGTMIAHATVADLPEPGGSPVAITLDKTVAELAAAEVCAVEIAFSYAGTDATVTMDRNFSMAGNGNVQVGFASGKAVETLLSMSLLVNAQSIADTDTVHLIAYAVS